MTENDWTKSVCEKLNRFLKKYSLYADTLMPIPYSQEIKSYTSEWKPILYQSKDFQTDLVVYEYEKNENIKPRIIIEAKLGHVSTHDAITYSYKADKHKITTPYLRYGIMIADRGDYPLPGRLFQHGTNFDFMFSFMGTDPTTKEWKSFKDMILKEVEYSRLTEKMLHDSRKKDRKKYYMLQKQLVLKELGK